MPAWTSIWNSLIAGNFSDAANYAFIDQSDVDTSNRLDSELEELSRDRLGEGKITQEQFDQTTANIQQTAFPYNFQNPDISPAIAFKNGLIEQAQKEMGYVEKGLQNTSAFIAGIIPWQVYAIAGVAVIIFVITKIPSFKKI